MAWSGGGTSQEIEGEIRMTKEPVYFAASLCNDNRNGKIIVQKTKLSLALKSFKIRGACQWNALPASIRNLANIGTFKKEVKLGSNSMSLGS